MDKKYIIKIGIIIEITLMMRNFAKTLSIYEPNKKGLKRIINSWEENVKINNIEMDKAILETKIYNPFFIKEILYFILITGVLLINIKSVFG